MTNSTPRSAGRRRPIRSLIAFVRSLIAFALTTCALPCAAVELLSYCGDEGVWLQILGSGGPELTDQRGAASYLVWVNENVRFMVNVGPGSTLRFDEAGARFEDLDAVVFTQLRPHTSSDFASLVEGGADSGRERLLPVFGPADPNGDSMTAFVQRMIGEDSLYPELASYLTFRSPGGYKVSVRDVAAIGNRRWAQYGTENITLAAVPVHHGGLPTLAWRVKVGGFTLVFAGGFSNRKDVIADFAKDADALIVHHAIQEDARGDARQRFAIPSQIGRIAAKAGVRMLVLGHRTSRTLGRERASRAAIEAHYDGALVFGNEMECWGL